MTNRLSMPIHKFGRVSNLVRRTSRGDTRWRARRDCDEKPQAYPDYLAISSKIRNRTRELKHLAGAGALRWPQAFSGCALWPCADAAARTCPKSCLLLGHEGSPPRRQFFGPRYFPPVEYRPASQRNGRTRRTNVRVPKRASSFRLLLIRPNATDERNRRVIARPSQKRKVKVEFQVQLRV